MSGVRGRWLRADGKRAFVAITHHPRAGAADTPDVAPPGHIHRHARLVTL